MGKKKKNIGCFAVITIKRRLPGALFKRKARSIHLERDRVMRSERVDRRERMINSSHSTIKRASLFPRQAPPLTVSSLGFFSQPLEGWFTKARGGRGLWQLWKAVLQLLSPAWAQISFYNVVQVFGGRVWHSWASTTVTQLNRPL